MLFNSLQFVVFCLIIIPVYFTLSNRFQNILLLLCSIFFYFTFGPYVILILVSIIVFDFFTGIQLASSAGWRRKVFFILGLLINIFVLLSFKYYNFINQNLGHILSVFHALTPFPQISIIVPVGLSYITFQSLSYKIEIYRKNIPAERDPVIFALFLMLFTKVIAGPIERPQKLIPQFKIRYNFDFSLFKEGMVQIAFGFFKKVVIADRLAIVVDSVYQNPSIHSGTELLVASLFYSFQIYCDFSGYTDIALGVSKIMGIRLVDNFNKPYFSKSISEFWKRWHISLSFWLRDYLFLPVSYRLSRKWKKKRYLFVRTEKWIYFSAALITFFICGLWHGSAWHYVFWGLLFAVYLCFSIATASYRKKFYKKIRLVKYPGFFSITKVITTFLLVTFTWIFFRADNISQGINIIKKIASLSMTDPVRFSINNIEMAFSSLLIIILIIKEKYFYVIQSNDNIKWFTIILLLSFCCYFFGIFTTKQVIYFQF